MPFYVIRILLFSRLEKSLPKLEKEIMSLAEACPAFKVFGKEVKDIIEDEREAFNREKEEKKMLKVSAPKRPRLLPNGTFRI